MCSLSQKVNYRVLEKEKRICKSVTYNILTWNNCLPRRCSIAPCVPDEIVNLNTPVTHPLPWSSSRSFHYELTSSRIPASSGLMWWGSHEGLDFTEDTRDPPWGEVNSLWRGLWSPVQWKLRVQGEKKRIMVLTFFCLRFISVIKRSILRANACYKEEAAAPCSTTTKS